MTPAWTISIVVGNMTTELVELAGPVPAGTYFARCGICGWESVECELATAAKYIGGWHLATTHQESTDA